MRMLKETTRKEDGRKLIYYSFETDPNDAHRELSTGVTATRDVDSKD